MRHWRIACCKLVPRTADELLDGMALKVARARWFVAAPLGVASVVACLPLEDMSGYSGADREGAALTASDELPPSEALLPAETLAQLPVTQVAVPSPVANSTEGAGGPLSTDLSFTQPAPLSTPGVAELGADAGAPIGATGADRTPLDAGREQPIGARCAVGQSASPSGHCYALVSDKLNWAAARTNCKDRGAGWDLASIRSEAESDFVGSIVSEEVWIGGSDARAEGTWVWVEDGFEFWKGEGSGVRLNAAFFNWFGTEPNGSLSSDCLRLLPDARWADYECDEVISSICQGPSIQARRSASRRRP